MATQYERLRAAVVAFVDVEDTIENLQAMHADLKVVDGDSPDAKAWRDLLQLLIDTHPENQ